LLISTLHSINFSFWYWSEFECGNIFSCTT